MNKISFNLPILVNPLKKDQNVNQNQHNPFATSFKGELKADTFERSTSSELRETNSLAKSFAELASKMNVHFEGLKNNTRNAFAPVVSFTSNAVNSVSSFWNKMNNTNVSDVVNYAKEELSFTGINREVRSMMKMPVADLREMLTKELAV